MYYIYIIKNSINDKVYIGRTINLEKRWRGHKSASCNKNDVQYNKPLYTDMRKLGIDKFWYEVLDSCESSKKASYLEDLYTQKFNSQSNGYNINSGNYWGEAQRKRMQGKNNPSYGVSKTPQQRKLISESRKGKAMNKSNYKSIEVIRLDTLEKYPSIQEAQRITGIHSQNIEKVLKGKRDTAGGIKWMSVYDYEIREIEHMADEMANDRLLFD